MPTNFLKKWAATPTKGTAQTGRAKIFQRFTATGGHLYSIGSITFMQYPAKDKLSYDDIVGDIPDAYGEKTWTKTIRGKSLVVEGIWKKGNRYIRYDVTRGDRFHTISIFTGRIGYLDSLLPEAKLIQENLARANPKVADRSFLKNFLGIPEAQAAGLGDLLGGGIGASGSGGGGVLPDLTELNQSMDSLSQSFEELNTQVQISNQNMNTANQNWNQTNQQLNDTTQVIDKNWSNTNTQLDSANQNWNNTNTQLNSANQNWNNTNQVIDKNWSDTNTQINSANQNWNNTNNQINNANQNWSNTNKIVDKNWAETNKQLEAANQNWADTNKIVDKNWQETNRQMERANNLAERMADPKNAFTLAAATSAGMVFGATLANLAIDGVVMGAKLVWDLLTDTSGKKERWDKFKEARQNWEKTAETAKNLEKILDQFLTTQELLGNIQNSIVPDEQDKLSRENLITHLSQRTRKLEKIKKDLEAEYAIATDEKCEMLISNKIDEADKMINSSKTIKEYLNKQNYKVYNNQVFCDDLKGIMGKLGEAESALQTYRLNILNARDQWEKENAKDRSKMDDTTERVNDRSVQEKTRDERIRNADKDYKRVLEGLTEEKERFVTDCKKSYSVFQNMSGKARNECELKYSDKFNKRDEEMKAEALRAKDRKIENARRDFEDSSKRFIHFSQDIEDSKLQSYYKWFADLEKQQYCFTHREEQECKDLGAVKFMGPFYVKNRAKVKLKEICGVDEFSY